jgi:hypothetical protein
MKFLPQRHACPPAGTSPSSNVLFGSEPFDRAHGPESIEGLPAKQKAFFASKKHTRHHIRVAYGADDPIPEGVEFMIQSPPPACAAEGLIGS